MMIKKTNVTYALFAMILIAMGAALLLMGCGKKEAPKEGSKEMKEVAHEGDHEGSEAGAVTLSPEKQNSFGIEVKAVTLADMAVPLSATAMIEMNMDRSAKISPRVTGRAARITASQGDRVIPLSRDSLADRPFADEEIDGLVEEVDAYAPGAGEAEASAVWMGEPAEEVPRSDRDRGGPFVSVRDRGLRVRVRTAAIEDYAPVREDREDETGSLVPGDAEAVFRERAGGDLPSFELDRGFDPEWPRAERRERASSGAGPAEELPLDPFAPEPEAVETAGPAEPEAADDGVYLAEVADESEIFDDPGLEVASLAAGEARDIIVPVEIRSGTETRRFKLACASVSIPWTATDAPQGACVRGTGYPVSMRRSLGTAVLASLVALSANAAGEQNLWEWMNVAPIVTLLEVRRQDGRETIAEVERVFRGALGTGSTIALDVRGANRERPGGARALDLREGGVYLALLEPAGKRRDPEEEPLYRLVRGVEGVREVPAEGASAWIEAADRIAAIRLLENVAIGHGDSSAARAQAEVARRHAGGDPLALLLHAQSAQLDGDRDGAQRAFRAMAERADTRLLGLRGLFIEAQRADDPVAAVMIAEEALKMTPSSSWASHAVLGFCCAKGDWAGALSIIDNNQAAGLIDKATYRRQRGVLLTARALEFETVDRDLSRSSAMEAFKLAPTLSQAAVLDSR